MATILNYEDLNVLKHNGDRKVKKQNLIQIVQLPSCLKVCMYNICIRIYVVSA